jgi:hypothetical protein
MTTGSKKSQKIEKPNTNNPKTKQSGPSHSKIVQDTTVEQAY